MTETLSDARATDGEARATDGDARATDGDARATDSDARATDGDARATKSLGRTSAGASRLELRTEQARVVCRSEPAVVTPGTPLSAALSMMRERAGGALLVADNGRLVGILTERDVLQRVLGRDVDPAQPVSEFMTAEPHTLPADATLLDAMRAMESGHYRHLPLIDEAGAPVALLRQQDLLEYIAEAFPQEILNLPPRPHQLMEEPEGA